MRKIIVFTFICLLLSGCIRQEEGVHIYNDSEADSQQAEKILAEDQRLVSATAIIHQKKLVSGMTVRTFSRFHKKKIEKELKQQLERAYPDFEVTVSADNKIVHKTTEIIQNTDKEQLDEQLKKIVSLLKEET